MWNILINTTLILAGRVGVKIVSKKVRQAVGKANRRHQVLIYIIFF